MANFSGPLQLFFLAPPLCVRQVLTNDETYKIGNPKSTIEVMRCQPAWSFSRKEHMRFRRQISYLTWATIYYKCTYHVLTTM